MLCCNVQDLRRDDVEDLKAEDLTQRESLPFKFGHSAARHPANCGLPDYFRISPISCRKDSCAPHNDVASQHAAQNFNSCACIQSRKTLVLDLSSRCN